MTLKPLFAPTARAVDQGRSHDAKSAMSALLINNTRSIENQCTVEECHSFSFDQRAHGVLPRRGWTLRVLRNRGPAAAAGSLKRLQTFCQPGDCAVDRRCRPRVHGDDATKSNNNGARCGTILPHMPDGSHGCSTSAATSAATTPHTPPLPSCASNSKSSSEDQTSNMQDRRNGCLARSAPALAPPAVV